MSALIKRNLKVFFRDRVAVLLSLLAIFIIIALYAVFLSDVWLPDSMSGIKDVKFLMNSWLVAGLLAVASVTTAMGAFGIMVEDIEKKTDKDFRSSPVKKSDIAGGYIFSAMLIGVIMTVITFVVSEIYIVLCGGDWLNPTDSLKVLLLVFLSTMTNTSMVCFIISFVRSSRALSTLSTIIGTLIGFLTGIYLPLGTLPASVQTVIKAFPTSHAAALFREILTDAPMKSSFEGVPVQYISEFKEYMGITYSIGKTELSPFVGIMILVLSSAIFYALSILNMSRQRKSAM